MNSIRLSPLALGVVLCLWAGIVFGVSFLATPTKFRAPTLTLPTALDIGRHTFYVLTWMECAAAALALGLSLVDRPSRVVWVCLLLACMILTAQRLWVLPELDARVQVILDGGQPAPSHYHSVFVLLESAKLLALLLGSTVVLWQFGADRN